MSESVSIAVIVVLAVAMALLGLAIVRRLAPVQALGQHTDVIGFVYAAIGVIYAVILALVVIAAWEDYRDAKAAVSDEATAVLNVARAANGWPSPDRENTEATLVDYARQVLDVEWPAMARGDFGPAMESGSVNRIWHALNQATATAETKSDSYSTALEALDTLGEARGERVLLGQDGLPRSMSVILIIGAVVTIAFTYLFVVETTWLHALMTASLTILVVLLFLLQYQLEMPFQGTAAIEPTPMELVLSEIDSPTGMSGMTP